MTATDIHSNLVVISIVYVGPLGVCKDVGAGSALG